MEEKYSDQTARFKQVAQWYLEHMNSYKRQIAIDIDLSRASKTKMKPLVEEFSARLSDFLRALAGSAKKFARVEQGLAPRNKAAEDQFQLLKDEFARLSKQFEKLSVTTPKLLEVKRRIDEKVALYDKSVQEKAVQRSFAEQRSQSRKDLRQQQSQQAQDLNEKWLDSLIADVSRKNPKLGSAKKCKPDSPHPRGDTRQSHAKKPSQQPVPTPKKGVEQREVSTYLTGFKLVQDEFSKLKRAIEDLGEAQRTHQHPEIMKRLEQLSLQTEKMDANGRVIQREHSELLHALHVMSMPSHLYSYSETSRLLREGERETERTGRTEGGAAEQRETGKR
ncbi:MAG: hypothetical protein P4M11_15100 [Candidatus Pacebacteria bacterium]|nr:hypothetical protein [Candidatus Paceibacterota bacterium]